MAGFPWKIAFDPRFAPISWQDSSGAACGPVVETLAGILRRAEIPHEFHPVEMIDMPDAIARGKTDAIAALAMTAPRRDEYDFSPAIARTGAAFFARGPFDPDRPHASIVTPRTGPLADFLRARHKRATLHLASGYAEALQCVASGRVQAAALNWHVGREICMRKGLRAIAMPRACFLAVDLALAVRKNTFAGELAALASHWPEAALDSAPPIDD